MTTIKKNSFTIYVDGTNIKIVIDNNKFDYKFNGEDFADILIELDNIKIEYITICPLIDDIGSREMYSNREFLLQFMGFVANLPNNVEIKFEKTHYLCFDLFGRPNNYGKKWIFPDILRKFLDNSKFSYSYSDRFEDIIRQCNIEDIKRIYDHFTFQGSENQYIRRAISCHDFTRGQMDFILDTNEYFIRKSAEDNIKHLFDTDEAHDLEYIEKIMDNIMYICRAKKAFVNSIIVLLFEIQSKRNNIHVIIFERYVPAFLNICEYNTEKTPIKLLFEKHLLHLFYDKCKQLLCDDLQNKSKKLIEAQKKIDDILKTL